MNKLLDKIIKTYDVILNVIFVGLLLWTAFVICYYTLPEQTSQVIAKALSYTDNPEVSSVFMNYLNGFTLGAGFPLWFSQKAMISRYMVGASNKFTYKNTQEILIDNLKLAEIQIEFQKAEALRFMNSPTMPAKARLCYKSFLSKLDEREEHIHSLQAKVVPTKKSEQKVKDKTKHKPQPVDKLDSLV